MSIIEENRSNPTIVHPLNLAITAPERGFNILDFSMDRLIRS
jgi:hypothetical protein